VFASGLIIGGALGALSWSMLTAVPRPRELAPTTAIAKVAGRDTDDETVRAADSAVDRAPPAELAPATRTARPSKSSVPAASTTTPEVAPEQQPRSISEIARSALGFTAFIRGGHVYGAGVLLDGAGHVLTCRHVIEGLDAITVSFSDGAAFPATLVDSDEALDIALLKIDSDRISELRPASIAGVQLGDDVLAIGAPRKMAFSLSRGMVSFVGRPFERIYYLQTDLAMNGGSSGGPVMNARGDVIALSSFVLRDSEGLAFALPIDYAYRRFAAHLQAPVGFESSAGGAFESWVSALERSGRRPSSKHD
jgi:S1-C subfamily serine protease